MIATAANRTIQLTTSNASMQPNFLFLSLVCLQNEANHAIQQPSYAQKLYVRLPVQQPNPQSSIEIRLKAPKSDIAAIDVMMSESNDATPAVYSYKFTTKFIRIFVPTSVIFVSIVFIYPQRSSNIEAFRRNGLQSGRKMVIFSAFKGTRNSTGTEKCLLVYSRDIMSSSLLFFAEIFF